MTFEEVLIRCSKDEEFVLQFDKLMGANLSFKGTALELGIDKASGKLKDDLAKFTYFVYETIWTRI